MLFVEDFPSPVDVPLLTPRLTEAVATFEAASLASAPVPLEERTPEQSSPLVALLRDAVVLVVSDRLPAAALMGAFTAAGLKFASAPASAGTLVDVLWAVSLELEAASGAAAAANGSVAEGANPDSVKGPLWVLGRALLAAGVISSGICMERLELEDCEALGLLRVDTARARLVKANTRALYTQVKFNLFAEESEGFAKLGVALLGSTDTSAASLARGVLDLTGRFALDPNRVFVRVLLHRVSRTRSFAL